MSLPTTTASALYCVWLREDLPRGVVRTTGRDRTPGSCESCRTWPSTATITSRTPTTVFYDEPNVFEQSVGHRTTVHAYAAERTVPVIGT